MSNATYTFRVLPSPGHILATLAADPTPEYIPALITDNGVTERLLGQQLWFVHFETMRPLLLGENLGPGQAFTLVYPWLARLTRFVGGM